MASYEHLIEALYKESQVGHDPYKLRGSSTGKKILTLTLKQQQEFVLEAIKWLGGQYPQPRSTDKLWHVYYAVDELLSHKIPFAHDDIVYLLNWICGHEPPYLPSLDPMGNLLERYLKGNPLTSALQNSIARVLALIEPEGRMYKYTVKYRILGQMVGEKLPIKQGEPWTEAAIEDIRLLDQAKQIAWIRLFDICLDRSRDAAPTTKWLNEASALIGEISFESFKVNLSKWFVLADKPRDALVTVMPAMSYYHRTNPDYPDPHNADVLKGLAWACVFQEDRELARALTALAISAYRKIPHVGPRCVRLGNACIWALGHMPGTEGVGQLALLKARVKITPVQKSIDKAFGAAATRLDLPQSEIEELSVPTYGLTEAGFLQKHVGDFTAELVVTGTSSTEIRWFNADGTPQKSAPKALKEQFGDELKELTQTAKEIAKMLPAQRDRLENLYLKQKSWSFPVWQERYLNHPLIGVLARRIIWQFTSGEQTGSGIWLAGQLTGCDGLPLDWVNEETQVELWHPVNDTTPNVMAWRNWLVWHNVQQPFKQAHREIYVLTDAERQTRLYSNRFAAHIIKQHQFHALCGVREWKNKLRLMVDDVCPPALKQLPEWGLRAEFWIESIGDNYGTDTTESGTYLYLATDQVRFYPLDARQNIAHVGGGGYGTVWHGAGVQSDPLPLEQIPPLVLTEILRDVDLFVGVCSVGNDPNWADGRLERHEQNYWYGYSFGNLSESAKIRKQELERIIPRLKIAARCQLTDKFLRVQGDIRAYKIHLGSGNILMEPNDQYLCIVPAQSAKTTMTQERVFLPFEGDNMVAIILSKAFLLAEDKKISDPTITRQLQL